MNAPLMLRHANADFPRAGRTLLLTALLALPFASARAGDVTLQGDRLALTTTGDTSVSIATQPGLSAAVHVVGDDLSCLKTQNNQVVEINTESCGDDIGRLTLLVPPGFPITLAIEGSGDVKVADVGGPLNATLDGDGGLTAARAGDLMLAVHGDGDASVTLVEGAADLRLSGSGDVKITRLQGLLHASLSGSGDLQVGSIAAPAADIAIQGSGSVTIGDGNIAALRGQTNGSGDLAVTATVTAADLQATGGGDMTLKNVTGVTKRNASGGSDINIGGSGQELNNLQQLRGLQNLDQLKELRQLDALKGMTINLSDDDLPHRNKNHDIGHFIAGILVLVVLYFAWRTIHRNGGWNAVRNRASTPAESTHPGVMAVRETLTRLDGRLAQVESYVTTREFDLHRKFRDLDK